MTRTYHEAVARAILDYSGSDYSEQNLEKIASGIATILQAAFPSEEVITTTASITPTGEGEPRTR